MTTETLREFLLWCAAIHYGVLLLWFAAFTFAHAWLYRLHGRWFALPVERFDAIHYLGMAIYKILVLVFSVVPLVALWAMR